MKRSIRAALSILPLLAVVAAVPASAGGLVGAMDKVADQIEGKPSSASSTDPSTGITTTSTRNADGSRTVVRTDADGNELSREARPPSR